MVRVLGVHVRERVRVRVSVGVLVCELVRVRGVGVGFFFPRASAWACVVFRPPDADDLNLFVHRFLPRLDLFSSEYMHTHAHTHPDS